MSVPTGWRERPLKVAFERPQTGTWGSDPHGEDSIPCARVADFDRAHLELRHAPTLRTLTEAERADRLLDHGDLLIEKSGGTPLNPVGFACMWTSSQSPATFSNFLVRLRAREGESNRFWLYSLSAAYEQRRTAAFVTQSTGIQNLNLTNFLSSRFLSPDGENQQKIASFLDLETAKIDALVAKQEQLIATLRERRRQALLHHIDHLRETPWIQIRHLAAVLNGGTPTSDAENWGSEIPFATPADLRLGNGSSLRSAQRSITTQGAKSGSTVAPAGSVLISTRAPIGYATVLRHSMAFNQGCRALVPTDNVDPDFLMLMMFGLADALAIDGRGTTFMEVSSGQVAGFRVPAPNIDRQREIVAIVRQSFAKIDALIAKAERFIELSKERRAALITAAVTGQLEIAGAQ